MANSNMYLVAVGFGAAVVVAAAPRCPFRLDPIPHTAESARYFAATAL
jgi:hypothetical protein